MRVPSNRRLVVRVVGVSHEIARAELVDVQLCRGVSPQPPTDLDGNTARVVLLCANGNTGDPSFVDPRTIVNVSDGTGVDCMTCLIRRTLV